MRTVPVFLLSWFSAGLLAVAGSIVGNAYGRWGLVGGAVAGGLLGVAAAVRVSGRMGWLPAGVLRGAFLGGVVGFAVALPVAVLSLDTPVGPAMSAGLVGAGVLLGAGAARR